VGSELIFFGKNKREFCRVSSSKRHDQQVLSTILEADASYFHGLALCETTKIADFLEFLCELRGLEIERHIEPPKIKKTDRRLLWFMSQGINTRRQLGEGGYLKECVGK
jgi:hypothetical protein